jgi:MFS transporter, MFS domain-containing protein family, molybdate-anion transporter
MVIGINLEQGFLVFTLLQTCFESSMYIFVFIWTPYLQGMKETEQLPLGIIFSCYMLSIMAGSQLFGLLVRKSYSIKQLLQLSLLISFICFTAVSVHADLSISFFLFNGFEVACGIYFPAIASFRTPQITESTRSTILNVARIPFNFIIVLVFLFVDTFETGVIFSICSILCVVGFLSLLYSHF